MEAGQSLQLRNCLQLPAALEFELPKAGQSFQLGNRHQRLTIPERERLKVGQAFQLRNRRQPEATAEVEFGDITVAAQQPNGTWGKLEVAAKSLDGYRSPRLTIVVLDQLEMVLVTQVLADVGLHRRRAEQPMHYKKHQYSYQ